MRIQAQPFQVPGFTHLPAGEMFGEGLPAVVTARRRKWRAALTPALSRREREQGHRIAQAGFTLVEMMVALVLGMLTVLVITQVLSMAEAQKRSLTTGGDAQVNGALALFALQRAIAQAGYGAAALPEAAGCELRGQFGAAPPFSMTLAPVVIANGGDAAAGNNEAPDAITVLQGRTTGPSTPMALTGAHVPDASSFAVASSFGVVDGDMLIAVPQAQGPGTWCTLLNATDDPSSPLLKIDPTRIPNRASSGSGGNWNHSALFPAAGYNVGDTLLNMGTLIARTYSLNNALNLQALELSSTSGGFEAHDLYPQIVNLQAFYGKDTDGDGVVDRYDATSPTTNEGWQQVLAVRIALVARSSQYEKAEVTSSAPLWDVGTAATFADTAIATCGQSRCISLKVDRLDDWQHYRYKVFDTIVPLRNVIWHS